MTPVVPTRRLTVTYTDVRYGPERFQVTGLEHIPSLVVFRYRVMWRDWTAYCRIEWNGYEWTLRYLTQHTIPELLDRIVDRAITDYLRISRGKGRHASDPAAPPRR